MAARRPYLPELLAAEHGAGARRRPGRERAPPAAAVDALSGARRRSARPLSGRRLLASPPVAARAPALERLRLLVSRRTGGDGGPAAGRYPRHHVRSGDAHLPPEPRARRHRDPAPRYPRCG